MAAKGIKVHEAGLGAVQLHVSHVTGAKPGFIRGHGGRDNVEQEARVADDHHTPMQTAFTGANGALDAQSTANKQQVETRQETPCHTKQRRAHTCH